MSAPRHELIKYEYQNPDASAPLHIPMLVVCNTSDEDLARNVKANTALDIKWLRAKNKRQNNSVAIMVGGGASIENDIEKIHELRSGGGTVFAMNGASRWARENAIAVDYQVIADAKAETATLVDPGAKDYLVASQVHSDTMDAVRKIKDPVLWHLETGDVEESFTKDRPTKGGYTLIGGGATVGNSALCVAYALGFREIHVFGYDSSHTDDRSHTYSQPMNAAMPCVKVKWGGEEFKTSVAMKAQAEKFQMTSQALKQCGCNIEVYGHGLLQTMYHTPPKNLSEQEKHQLMWQFDIYREESPGERQAESYLDRVKPDGMIIDFGCGTGRAGLIFKEAGHDVLLMDFASNCRDEEAMALPFLEWDLTNPIPSRANYGYCTDVMEHIPPDDVKTVLKNIMEAAGGVFFQISTIDDVLGDFIDTPLHLSVYPHDKWVELLSEVGTVEWSNEQDIASMFYVRSR